MIDGQKRERWTPEDLQFLKDNWGKIPIIAIADHLHRTPRSVEVKGYNLQLGSASVATTEPQPQPNPVKRKPRQTRQRPALVQKPVPVPREKVPTVISDPELIAMRGMLVLLEKLDHNAQRRAMEWVYARLEMSRERIG